MLLWHSSKTPILMVWKDVQQFWSSKRLSVTVLALMAGAEELHWAGGVPTGAVLVEVWPLDVGAKVWSTAAMMLKGPRPVP